MNDDLFFQVIFTCEKKASHYQEEDKAEMVG